MPGICVNALFSGISSDDDDDNDDNDEDFLVTLMPFPPLSVAPTESVPCLSHSSNFYRVKFLFIKFFFFFREDAKADSRRFEILYSKH